MVAVLRIIFTSQHLHNLSISLIGNAVCACPSGSWWSAGTEDVVY
jgi:hypothetical protein